MIISSELTGKVYETVDECLAAEAKYKKKKEEEEKAKKAHDEAVNKAYEEAVAACERFFEISGISFF